MLASLLMSSLILVSALVIDVANAYQKRTQLQHAADAAALAAAQDLPDLDTAVATVKRYVAENYGIAVSAWVGCLDGNALELTPDANNECISFNADKTKIRVNMPKVDVDAFFATIAGHERFRIGADAVAASFAPGANARILPATVSGSMGTGLLCIENAGNNQDCANRSSGNFGSLNSPRLEILRPESGTLFDELAINYAMNVDHDLAIWDGVASAVCDGKQVAPCVANNESGATANHLVLSTGNDVRPVTEGYVSGFTTNITDLGKQAFCGRLTRPDATAANALDPYPEECTPGAPTINVLGESVNGRHIYYWMTDKARESFYPEVYKQGYADTDLAMANTNPDFARGDERLECYLAGYRYDSATGAETIPDCTHVGLPNLGTVSRRTTLDLFGVNGDYGNNDGDVNFSSPWVETGDDGLTMNGNIQVISGNMWFSLDSTLGLSMERYADLSQANLPDRVSGTGYWTVRMNNQMRDPDSAVALQLTYDGGKSWQTVFTFTSANTSTVGVGGSIGAAREVPEFGFRLLQTGAPQTKNERITFSEVRIEWDEGSATASYGPLFRSEMKYDPRYGVIPQVFDWPATGEKAAPLEGYWASYSYHLYTTSTKLQGFDAWVLDPALVENHDPNQSMTYGFAPEPRISLVE